MPTSSPVLPIRELVVDAYGCQCDLNDVGLLEKSAVAAARSVGAQIAERVAHRFQPHGATLCLILKESHLLISTWPEYQFAIVNIFLCNAAMDPKKCWAVMEMALRPNEIIFHEVAHAVGRQRGVAA